jgi:hypothetical protein
MVASGYWALTETTGEQPPTAENRISGRRIVSGSVGRSSFTQTGHRFSNCPSSAPSLPISDSPSPDLSVSSLCLPLNLCSLSLDPSVSRHLPLPRCLRSSKKKEKRRTRRRRRRKKKEERRKKKKIINRKEELGVGIGEGAFGFYKIIGILFFLIIKFIKYLS